MSSDADRILAEGVPIRLLDGRTPHLRYSMLSLKRLEDIFGSLEEADEALQSGKVITALVHWLACGLLHEKLDEKALDALLDVRRTALREYTAAIRQAAAQALGDQLETEPEQGPAPNLQAEEVPGSPLTGEPGTSSAPSFSDEVMLPSGA